MAEREITVFRRGPDGTNGNQAHIQPGSNRQLWFGDVPVLFLNGGVPLMLVGPGVSVASEKPPHVVLQGEDRGFELRQGDVIEIFSLPSVGQRRFKVIV